LLEQKGKPGKQERLLKQDRLPELRERREKLLKQGKRRELPKKQELQEKLLRKEQELVKLKKTPRENPGELLIKTWMTMMRLILISSKTTGSLMAMTG
jgi:hypothetical protein